jgi:hypothetical protein
MPRPFPSTSSPIYYLLMILIFDATYVLRATDNVVKEIINSLLLVCLWKRCTTSCAHPSICLVSARFTRVDYTRKANSGHIQTKRNETKRNVLMPTPSPPKHWPSSCYNNHTYRDTEPRNLQVWREIPPIYTVS